MAFTLWDDNSHLLTVGELKDAAGDYINDAAVTVTLTSMTGTEVSGEVWPMSLAYDGNSTGTYTVDLSSALETAPNDRLWMLISAIKGQTAGSWKCKITVRQRGC